MIIKTDNSLVIANLQAEITTLRARVAELESGGWISVDDRLPKDNVEVLCAMKHSPNSYHIHDGYLRRGVFRDGHGFEFLFTVTYWQPLPIPPKK